MVFVNAVVFPVLLTNRRGVTSLSPALSAQLSEGVNHGCSFAIEIAIPAMDIMDLASAGHMPVSVTFVVKYGHCYHGNLMVYVFCQCWFYE